MVGRGLLSGGVGLSAGHQVLFRPHQEGHCATKQLSHDSELKIMRSLPSY